MENSANKLQEIRRGTIPGLIQKYQSLVDKIFKLVDQPLPDFTDIKNKDEEIVSTAEQQKFFFINERDKALDNANSIMHKINKLEIELYAPELLNKKEEESEERESPGKKNWTKKKAEENK
jgi:hypothetical protein